MSNSPESLLPGYCVRGLLLLSFALLIFGCTPLPKGDLEPGVPVEREIGGAEAHSYRLPVAASSYISLRIEQPGIDIKARLDGPGGVSIPAADDPCEGDGPVRLAAILRKAGEYRLIVRPKDSHQRRGLYRVEILELRQTQTGDVDRLAGEKEYEEGRRLLCGFEERSVMLSRSLPRFERALQLWERGGDLAGQSEALVQIAENHSAEGRAKEAVAPSSRALQLAQRIGYREGEARARHALGNAYGRLSEWPKATEEYNIALQLWRSLRDRRREGTVLYSLGNALSNQGRLGAAAELLQQAYPLLLAVDRTSLALKALLALGRVRLDRGETSQALKTYEKVLAQGRSLNDLSVQAAALYNLGVARRQRGEFELARQLFAEALAINHRLGELQYEAITLQALGAADFNLGDLESALTQFRLALAICRQIERKDLEARLLSNIGYIYQAQGRLETALNQYRLALPLNEEAKSESGAALTLHDIGVANTLLHRPAEGLSFLRRALDLQIELGDRVAEASSLMEVGTAYQELGDFRQAADYLRRALEQARSIESTSLQAECLFRWAALENKAGRLPQALDRIRQSLEIIESLRSSVVDDKLRTFFFASKRTYYELYMDLLMRLEELQPGAYRTAAFEASERARARSLLDLLARGNIDVQQGIASNLKQREVELRARLSVLQEKLGNKQSPGTEPTRDVEQQLVTVQAAMTELESQIRKQYRHYAEVRYPTPLRMQDIQGLLDERTALLQYFTGERSSYLFVVTRNGLESHPLPRRGELAGEVTMIRRLLQERGRRQLRQYQDLGERLYQQLIAPAAGILQQKDCLLIAPDGPLYLLPFEALLTNSRAVPAGTSFRDLPYLLRRFAVSYVPSASVLHDLRAARPVVTEAATAAKRFLGFADPIYSGPGSGQGSRGVAPGSTRAQLAPLPESKREVQRIAELYPKTAVALYLGPAATEENVKSNEWLQRARQIHFAAHGSLIEGSPQLSGLELTRPPNSLEDGRLTVQEIFNLRLDADLLTLSACDTALGQEVKGEGVVGLTRAFFYAGARSLVVSLWPVSERSTPDLMFNFYRRLKASERKVDALRQAKLAAIRSESLAAPYYWAPFILSGDNR